jgi:plastocyanin
MVRFTALLVVVAGLMTAVALPMVTRDAVGVAAAQESYVSMQFNRFAPEEIAVPAGATVIWVNEDYDSGEWHDVIAEDGSFASESFPPGGAFSVSFPVPGLYVYYCDLHEGMFGRIFVE